MRIILTGAAGFLGREIARELRARGHRVAGMRRRLDGQSPDDFIGDFLQPESYRAALRNFAPDILIHCGWHGVPARSRDLLDQLDNVPAAGRLAEAGADAGTAQFDGEAHFADADAVGDVVEHQFCHGKSR